MFTPGKKMLFKYTVERHEGARDIQAFLAHCIYIVYEYMI